ncbi:MAG: hypothetical protein HFG31_09170 [Eubacterium sp.]|nr:hypothetical protein [Eubacterium sp.]
MKKITKKIVASFLSLTLVVGMTSTVFAAHAANGANVATGIKWSSFSVCTKEDHKEGEDGSKAHPWCWYHSLEHINTPEFPDGQREGQHFATKGYIAAGSTASSVHFYVANSGWDGEYNPMTGELAGDNPYGLRFMSSGFPVEKGRSYDISFKIKSTLKGETSVKDEAGNEVKDENGNVVKKSVTKKHILFKAYNPTAPGEPGVAFTSTSGCTVGGMIETDSATGEKTVTAKILVPKTYDGTVVALNFACGAFLKTYPEEVALSGSLYFTDVQVKAGAQYAVKYTYGSKSYTEYVNSGDKTYGHNFGIKGKTLTGYKNASTGAKFNLSTPVRSNLTLNCIYTATKKPGKAKVKVAAQKKKAKLTFTKIANAKGYEIKYSDKKNMKKAKVKRTTKKSLTIKKLKSGKKTYFQIKAYNIDSAGKRVYSKKTLKKNAFIK